MSAAERLVGVRAKIERAKQHVSDLEGRIGTFRETNPYRLVTEVDSQTRHTSYKVRVHSAPPIELGLVAGEAVHQLRSSLDHLAWQLVEANGHLAGSGTYFPICQTAPTSAQDKKSFERKVKGMSASVIGLIETLQPYQAGDTNLWTLHKLDNFDKHCLLLMAACDVEGAGIQWTKGPRTPQSAVMFLGMPGKRTASGKYRILQDGTEIGGITGSFAPDVNQEFQVSFEIAFGKPEIVEGQPVLPFLHQLADLVDGIVGKFVPFL